jgi:hypothetical protein
MVEGTIDKSITSGGFNKSAYAFDGTIKKLQIILYKVKNNVLYAGHIHLSLSVSQTTEQMILKFHIADLY